MLMHLDDKTFFPEEHSAFTGIKPYKMCYTVKSLEMFGVSLSVAKRAILEILYVMDKNGTFEKLIQFQIIDITNCEVPN